MSCASLEVTLFWPGTGSGRRRRCWGHRLPNVRLYIMQPSAATLPPTASSHLQHSYISFRSLFSIHKTNPHSVSFQTTFLICAFRSSHERAEPQRLRSVSNPAFSFWFAYLIDLSRSCRPCSPSDPFADEGDPLGQNNDVGTQQNYIHIRIQQRNGRKTLTTLQGLPKGAFWRSSLRLSFSPG